MFRHPKYYKNLRKLARNRKLQEIVDGIAASATDQAISSNAPEKPAAGERSPGPGPKLQASSNKLKETQASSGKHQAPSTKAQA